MAILFVEATLLLVGLIFLGGWGGADSGGILPGILLVAGLPIVIFGTCATVAAMLLRAMRPGLALAIAMLPGLAFAGLWILPRL
jgi:hypothetical protein